MLELESDPYAMFVFAMNAKQSRDKYTARLKRFFDFNNSPGDNIEERGNLAVQKERSKTSNSSNCNNDKWFLNNVLRSSKQRKIQHGSGKTEMAKELYEQGRSDGLPNDSIR